MNIIVQMIGLEEAFKPENLATPQNVEAAIQSVLSLEDEHDRLMGNMYLSEALAVAKQWDKAEEIARVQHKIIADAPEDQAWAFRTVASYLLDDGQVERAIRLLHEYEPIISTIETLWQRAEALNCAAQLFFRAGRCEDALQWHLRAAAVAQDGEQEVHSQDGMDASSVLKEVARDLAHEGKVTQAKEVALSIKNTERRKSALKGILERKQLSL